MFRPMTTREVVRHIINFGKYNKFCCVDLHQTYTGKNTSLFVSYVFYRRIEGNLIIISINFTFIDR